MSKILRSNFSRLWRSWSFWAILAVSVGCGVLIFCKSHSDGAYGIGDLTPATFVYTGFPYMLIFTSFFSALFLGTDFMNNTVRNKLIVGHARSELYFANLIVTTVGSLIIAVISLAVPLIIGLSLGGTFGIPIAHFLLFMLIGLLAVAAMSAVCTALGMLIARKSAITVVTVLLVFGMTIAHTLIGEALTHREPHTVIINGVAYEATDSQYIGGAPRVVMMFVNNVLPGGQLAQITRNTGSADHPYTWSFEAGNLSVFPLYSLGVIAVSTAAGILAFRKKDLK